MAHTVRLSIVPDQCCALCNPASLVDFEGPCLRVETSGRPWFLCLTCVARFDLVATTGAPAFFDLDPHASDAFDAMNDGIIINGPATGKKG